MYFNTSTQVIYNTIGEIRAAHPGVSFPDTILDALLESHSIFPITEDHNFGPSVDQYLSDLAAERITRQKEALLVQLQLIDQRSIRAIRSVDTARMNELEESAIQIRSELSNLM